MNKRKIFSSCLFFIMLGSTALGSKVYAASVPIPTITNIYNLNNHAKIEVATDMAPEDIIRPVNFETYDTNISMQWAGQGNQSITNETAYDGTNSLKVFNTLNHTGNLWCYPSTYADASYTNFGVHSATNGTWFSVSYKMKATGGTNGNSVGTFNLQGGHLSHGVPRYDYSGRNIKYGETVNWNSPPSSFSVYTDGGPVNLPNGDIYPYVCGKGTNYNYRYAYYKFNAVTQRMENTGVISGGCSIFKGDIPPVINSVFYRGESLLYVGGSGGAFGSRTIPNNGTWVQYSSNTQLNADLNDYDFSYRGFYPCMVWQTDGNLYLDDIKFGYASKISINRDGTNIYSGYASDFEDYNAKDNAVPNAVGGISNNFYSGVSHITWNQPGDNGTGYNYTVQGIAKTGNVSPVSGNYRLTIASGIKGYSIVIDNNPNTVPSNIITTTATSFNAMDYQGGYFHIAAIDNAGNISSVSHFNIDKIAPTNPIISTSPVIAPAPFNWTNSNVSVTMQNGTDSQTGIARTEYSIDLGNTWNVYTSPVILSVEKAYTVIARTVDNGGNYSGISQTKFGIDRTYPTATATISQDTTTLYSSIVTKRNVVINLSGISDNISGQYTVRLANKADFSDATGYINVQSLTSKQINFTLDQRTPYTANYTDRIVYVEIKDIAGNSQILQATTKLEPFAPSMPVITNPLDNTVRLIKEGTMIEWKYSDINNDPSPLAQAKSELFIYKGTDLVKDFILNGTASSVYVNDLPYGEYTVKVTVWNSLGKSATSNPSTLRINKFLNEGSLITKAFTTSSPMKYVEVLTTSEIPFGTELYVNIYIADKDGNYDSSKPIKTEIHNVRDNKNLIKLPYSTSNLRVEYKLYNKTSPVNDTLTPTLDNITVLAK